MPGNQPWTKQAAVLMVSIERQTFVKNGKPNPWSTHDVGMANAQLMLQAAHRDIYGHMMAGFDATKTPETLGLSEAQRPVCMITLGYLGKAEQLEEPDKQRELTTRSRLSINEFTRKL
ncbi:MAG: nitroreductase family protein [Bacteroidota bacterium]